MKKVLYFTQITEKVYLVASEWKSIKISTDKKRKLQYW